MKISYGTPSPQNSDHIHIVKIFYHVPICVYYLQAMCEYYSANTFTHIMKQKYIITSKETSRLIEAKE